LYSGPMIDIITSTVFDTQLKSSCGFLEYAI